MKQIFIIFQDGAVSIDATESNLEIVQATVTIIKNIE
jgi:hypothetical protein